MSIFHGAISGSVMGCPRRGLSCAKATAAKADTIETTSMFLGSDDIAHLPSFSDRPALDTIVVLHEGIRMYAACNADLLDSRLHITRAVHHAALKHREPAIPIPWHSESGQALFE